MKFYTTGYKNIAQLWPKYFCFQLLKLKKATSPELRFVKFIQNETDYSFCFTISQRLLTLFTIFVPLFWVIYSALLCLNFIFLIQLPQTNINQIIAVRDQQCSADTCLLIAGWCVRRVQSQLCGALALHQQASQSYFQVKESHWMQWTCQDKCGNPCAPLQWKGTSWFLCLSVHVQFKCKVTEGKGQCLVKWANSQKGLVHNYMHWDTLLLLLFNPE